MEFRGGDVFIGSAPDCAVRLDAPGIEAHHARILIDITGATIYRVDGAVGVNDDLVTTDALLRSGDFVWIGEPAGPSSIMLQFTLGDVEETPEPAPEVRTIEPAAEVFVEEVAAEDLASHHEVVEELLVEEPPAETAAMAPPAEAEMMEMAPEPEVVEHAFDEPHVVEPEAAHSEVVESEAAESMTLEADSGEISKAPPAEIESISELEPAFEQPTDSPSPSPSEPAAVVPKAPWQMPPANSTEPAAPAEYASAWESAPAAPAAAPEAESAEAAAPAPTAPSSAPTPTPARPATPPTVPPVAKRPTQASPPKVKIRTVEQDAALRTPPPPPPPIRTTSSTPMVVGGLVALIVLAGAGFFFLRPAPAPVPPPPTPTPVVVSTPQAATPEPTQVAVVAPTPEPPPPPVATPVAPTPRAVATPALKPTPAPRATPTPRATPSAAAVRPGNPAPTVAPTTAAPAAPVSQAPRLLEEARAAASARDLPRALQLLDQVLRLEPGNPEATARKAEVDARMAALGRRFSVGATTVVGGKSTGKGPTGFDLGGGAVVKTDFSAQIRCTTTPTSVEAGMPYSVRCSILNIGTKAFKLENIAANETLDGVKGTGAGTAPRPDIAPQSDAVILERSGTWNAKSQWSIELVAKTTKDESFRAVYSWR